LPITEQDHVRWQVAKSTNKLYNSNPTSHCNYNENKIIKNIKGKLNENKATITWSDKGNTLVIIYRKDYNQKINDFITTGQFSKLTKDPTNTCQKSLRTCLNKFKYIISDPQKSKLININPMAPNIKGLIKIHKLNHPIRPIVNWKNAPLYQTAKYFADTLNQYVTLPNAFNIKNTPQLIADLKSIKTHPNCRLASFDITNMYTNIPTDALKHIIENALKNNSVDTEHTQEILTIYDLIIKQNYFTHDKHFWHQKTGLAMGAPSSAIPSEFFLQYVEGNHIIDILANNKVLG
jgi:hypothetical protein